MRVLSWQDLCWWEILGLEGTWLILRRAFKDAITVGVIISVVHVLKRPHAQELSIFIRYCIWFFWCNRRHSLIWLAILLFLWTNVYCWVSFLLVLRITHGKEALCNGRFYRWVLLSVKVSYAFLILTFGICCEERMLQTLVSCRSLVRIELKHLFNEVNCLYGSWWNDFSQRCRCYFRKINSSLWSELVPFLPISGWCSECWTNFHKLVRLWIAWEYRPKQVHFCDDTSHGKDVNRWIVTCWSD